MYVEGDKGTGRFGFTVGVLLEGGCLTCEELVGVTAFGTFITVFEIYFHNYGNDILV